MNYLPLNYFLSRRYVVTVVFAVWFVLVTDRGRNTSNGSVGRLDSSPVLCQSVYCVKKN